MKTEAKNRVEVAATACDKAIAHWQACAAAVNADVGVNGYGIIRDRSAFRQMLGEAQARIAASFAALDAVAEWPSNADYDQL